VSLSPHPIPCWCSKHSPASFQRKMSPSAGNKGCRVPFLLGPTIGLCRYCLVARSDTDYADSILHPRELQDREHKYIGAILKSTLPWVERYSREKICWKKPKLEAIYSREGHYKRGAQYVQKTLKDQNWALGCYVRYVWPWLWHL
jgi:hypothetical protein